MEDVFTIQSNYIVIDVVRYSLSECSRKICINWLINSFILNKWLFVSWDFIITYAETQSVKLIYEPHLEPNTRSISTPSPNGIGSIDYFGRDAWTMLRPILFSFSGDLIIVWSTTFRDSGIHLRHFNSFKFSISSLVGHSLVLYFFALISLIIIFAAICTIRWSSISVPYFRDEYHSSLIR